MFVPAAQMSLVHLNEFESAERAERTLSGHDESVEALSCRCMWMWGETDYVSSYYMWWWRQLYLRGQTWFFQPLPVSTVPNTGENRYNSNYRGLDQEKRLEYTDVQLGQTPSHNRPETGCAEGFPHPFLKSLLRNVLVGNAVLVSLSVR